MLVNPAEHSMNVVKSTREPGGAGNRIAISGNIRSRYMGEQQTRNLS